MYVSINGQLVPLEKAMVPAEGEGFAYGYGVFETIKFENKKIYFLKEHLERLKDSLKKIHLFMDLDESLIQELFQNLIKENHITSGVLKISCTKNGNRQDVILFTRENKYNDTVYRKGFKLCFTDVKRNPYSITTYIKSHNYMENLLVKQQTLSAGYDEAIFTNIYDEICEGSLSNIFFVRNGKLYTPAVECGILPGIMRRKVIYLCEKHMVPIEIGKYTKEDLLMAEEIFITNSLMEIMPVSKIDDHVFDLKTNLFTQRIMRYYSNYITTL